VLTRLRVWTRSPNESIILLAGTVLAQLTAPLRIGHWGAIQGRDGVPASRLDSGHPCPKTRLMYRLGSFGASRDGLTRLVQP
jgi:hypothetical protein